MRHPPTGTVTFLFTDIEGSTKLWESSAEAMRTALARHDEIVRNCLEMGGGYVFKTIGDAFCAAFHTASEAVAAAFEAQQSLFAADWTIKPPVRARMALHTGAADERGGDYFGPPVNRAARLLAAGHGGQTLVSAATQELIRDTLPPGCSLIDLGDTSLKDLTRPERVYQLRHPQLPSEFPALRGLNSPELPNNLPQQMTSFIGREKELDEIKALLGTGEGKIKKRLLTLVGAGGAGKTRLALQAAADLLNGDGDGVWQVELAPLSDASLVPDAVAQALGVQQAVGESVSRTLIEALRSKSLLIVLDNCEHLIASCALLVADVLRECPRVHVLATSREPLGVPGEQVYRIPSLTTPELTPGRGSLPAYSVESLTAYESVRLFIDRAKAVQPAFAVTDANAPALAQVCIDLDGIPLAIELAAARLRTLSVEEVNAKLHNRFRLLTGGSRTLLPRQQTLRALIDWSYGLLNDQEKEIWQRLSVFAGGWTLDAAEKVCAEGDIEKWEILDLITSLTDKSIIVRDEVVGQDAGTSSRYHLQETIRQFGSERLAESGETDAVQGRHRDWCLLLVQQSEPELRGPEQSFWMTRLEAEHDNLRAALSWTGRQGGSSTDVSAGLTLAAGLWLFWTKRGYFTEAGQWLSQSLRRAEGQSNEATPELLRAQSKALMAAGAIADTQGEYESARSLNQQSLTVARRLGDQLAISAALNNLGSVANSLGDYAAARALHQESLDIRRRTGRLDAIAKSLGNLGSVAHNEGDHATARALHEESLTIDRQIGNLQGSAVSLLVLGEIAQARSEFQASLAYYQESLTILSDVGDQHFTPFVLEAFASLHIDQGQEARGTRLLGAAAALRERIGSPRPINDKSSFEARHAAARASLGQDAYDLLWNEGQSMSWEQAAAYALGDSE